jgi:ribose-phosphate pyrophosphokinase
MKNIISANMQDVLEPNVEIKRFPDGDCYVRVLDLNGLVGKRARIYHRLYPNQDSAIIQAILIAQALEGASSLELIAPYLPYSRQDKIWKPGEALSSKAIIRMLKKAGFDTIITFDCHFLKEPGEFTCWGMKIKNISLAHAIKEKARKMAKRELVVISPDEGARYMSGGKSMKKIRGEYKTTNGITYRTIARIEMGERLDGKDVLIIDDMIASGGTMIKAVENARKNGARRVFVGATHGFFLNNALEKLKEISDGIIVSNTIPNPISTINFLDYLD